MLRTMGALVLCGCFLTGCLQDPQKRMQIAEENEKERDLEVRTIGDVTDIDTACTIPLQVDGVGLVTGLAGTGHCPMGVERDLLYQYLLKHNTTRGGEIAHIPNEVKVRQILEDPNNALVRVQGFIPAGAHRGDRFDVEITLPKESKASSLAGGYLELCTLRIYEKAIRTQKVLEGHILAHAKGKLFVGFGANTDPHELRHARIWQAGISRIDRPYSFCMRDDKKSLAIASTVAKRINFMYQDDPNSPARRFEFTTQEKQLLTMGNVANQLNVHQDPYGIGANDVAKATKESIIQVRVPAAYRFDHDRFARVALYTPLRDTDEKLPRYQQRLQKMVLDPSDCKWAQWSALHLEALGREAAEPTLKRGLTSEHPFIRFVCAESLAYLGSTAGVDTLAELARTQPILAKNCTIALANVSETIALDRLGELLTDDDPSLRCAAFHALTLVCDGDPRHCERYLGGTFLGDSFWLYRVPHTSSPMVYFSTSKRPQVVVFGTSVILVPDTRMMVGTRREFTVAHDKEHNKFVVKRFTSGGEAQRIVGNHLEETLNALAELGASYPDIVDFLRQAQVYQAVNCPIVHWSVPDVSVDTLVEAGKGMK